MINSGPLRTTWVCLGLLLDQFEQASRAVHLPRWLPRSRPPDIVLVNQACQRLAQSKITRRVVVLIETAAFAALGTHAEQRIGRAIGRCQAALSCLLKPGQALTIRTGRSRFCSHSAEPSAKLCQACNKRRLQRLLHRLSPNVMGAGKPRKYLRLLHAVAVSKP